MNIDRRKMKGVQERALKAVTQNKEFETPEVIFGLAELVGRLIARQTGGTWMAKKEIFDAVVEHIETSVRAGVADAPARSDSIILLN